MKVSMSTLARSVFDQTCIDCTLVNAWWVECMLQTLKINGLVKMINGSKCNDVSYIEGYLPKYKWALRPQKLDIDKCAILFEIIQITEQDFSWGCWSELVTVSDIVLFKECILTAVRFGAGLSYALTIYKNKEMQSKQKMNDIQKCMVGSDLPVYERNVSNLSINQWNKLREMI